MTRMSDREGTLVVCVRNTDYAVSLETRKVYLALSDETATERGLMRIIDESGEDYLYPADYFLQVDFPAAVRDTLMRLSGRSAA
jgi:hypothetical protein